MPKTKQKPEAIVIPKTTVSSVVIEQDNSVTNYRGDLSDILTALSNTGYWEAEYEKDNNNKTVDRVTKIFYPNIDRHPGHVHGTPPGAWKYNIEEGKNSVDRLVASARATIENQSTSHDERLDKYTISVTISIICSIRVLENTH